MMPDEFFKKNVEMWEKFTGNYMDMMFKTVEKTLEQSRTFQEKMNEAVNKSVSGQMDATMSALEALQRQVESLSAKVDELMEMEKSKK